MEVGGGPRGGTEGSGPAGGRRRIRAGANKHREMVLAERVEELRAGLMVEVGDATSVEGVGRAGEFGEVECEWDLALEPRLHGVAISRDNVHRIGTGECSDVEVHGFGEFCGRGGRRTE